MFLPRSSFHFVQAKRKAKRAGDAREAEAQSRTRVSKQKNIHIHPGRGRGGKDIGQVPCPLRYYLAEVLVAVAVAVFRFDCTQQYTSE